MSPTPQPSLFAPLDEGCRLRDEGAQLAADSVHGHWRVAAEVELERLAATGQPFTTENLYAVIGEPPGHRNATGGLFICGRPTRAHRTYWLSTIDAG